MCATEIAKETAEKEVQQAIKAAKLADKIAQGDEEEEEEEVESESESDAWSQTTNDRWVELRQALLPVPRKTRPPARSSRTEACRSSSTSPPSS